ncbi:MAG: glucans biosynthesis glucosyltransferase MdoH [Acetobacteraceae bacterium]
MALRRLLVLAIVLLTVLSLAAALHAALAPGGWTAAKLLMMASFLGVIPWAGFCLANGLIGFVLILTRGRRIVPLPPLDPGALPRTAIGVTVRNEDINAVLPPLRRLLAALDGLGVGDRFALFVLSDTGDPGLAATEEEAVAVFRAADRDPSRVRYRRRARNDGFKAGNIMDFLRHHAAGFELMLVLDADSRMSAVAVLRLVREIHAHPHLAIVQHLTVGLPAVSAFPRLFQYGMRAGMRTWATALAWWQGDESCYWGHNAVLRIAPFRAHCLLPRLPGGRHILSHDQFEAAMLAGAGWGVRLIPEEDGSAEANPPAFPEFLRRELRWLAGNFEYRHLLGMPGLRPMGRWQLIQAILLFASAPFYVVFLLAAAWAAATDTISPFLAGPVLTVMLGWACALYAPKLLGYLEILLSPRKRARYGGAARVLAGAATEVVFALLIDAVVTLSKTFATIRLALGVQDQWLPQNRCDRGVPWSEAVRLFWPHTLLGAVVFAAFGSAGWTTALWAAPLAGGLLLAVPICVLTAWPTLGRWMRRHAVAGIPEEVGEAMPARD